MLLFATFRGDEKIHLYVIELKNKTRSMKTSLLFALVIHILWTWQATSDNFPCFPNGALDQAGIVIHRTVPALRW